jgi:prepilin-type N-terminal cleavage/methylation domain-containing protein
MLKFLKIDEKRPAFTLIELLIVVAIIGILAAIAIPQYAKYRKGAQDNAGQAAYRSIGTAEEAYFAQNNAYTDAYTTLAIHAALTKDQNVNYGTITLTTSATGDAGFVFSVRHKADGSTIYTYNSAIQTTVTSSTGALANTWS